MKDNWKQELDLEKPTQTMRQFGDGGACSSKGAEMNVQVFFSQAEVFGAALNHPGSASNDAAVLMEMVKTTIF